MRQKPRNAEQERLAEQRDRKADWQLWGPYLAERQWGTVREDNSARGDAWDSFPHDHARSRAYRWGEDGLLGICDQQGQLCFSLALWNGRDAILKERLFGLTNSEGNHGEDVKEQYYYLDATPTHSYLKALYKYPQREFPYADLVNQNRHRSKELPEYELIDTGAFDQDRYFDVFIEYAKASPTDLRIGITVENRGPDAALVHVLPQLFFRNTWDWKVGGHRPVIARDGTGTSLRATHQQLGSYFLYGEQGDPLFTDNQSNAARLWGAPSNGPAKDAFHEYIVQGNADAVRKDGRGTKAAIHTAHRVPPGGSIKFRLRLCAAQQSQPFTRFDAAIELARRKADAF